MKITTIRASLLGLFFLMVQCHAQKETNAADLQNDSEEIKVAESLDLEEANWANEKNILPAADSPEEYLPLLANKKVGLVTNQTGVVNTHDGFVSIADFLLENGVEVLKVFAPEHGFRGKVDAGEVVKDGKDLKTGLPIISLYGSNKKPTVAQLADLDAIVFDIQDVGVRFYTYISTLHYVMEAAAEQNLQVIVLDRPNPNGHYIDGPILEEGQKTFVGLHPVPIVYGMTIGEYGLMVNGEGWLKNGIQCDLTVVPVKNYTHQSRYDLPIKPSPNLPNAQSINLYPSLCFFEGAQVSEGRGTPWQFQVFGSPYLLRNQYNFEFEPQPNEGAKHPQFQGKICHGLDLREHQELDRLNLQWLIDAYKNYSGKESFWVKNSGSFWIDKLAGTPYLRKQIEAGWSEEEIKAQWTEGLSNFRSIRSKYLIYP